MSEASLPLLPTSRFEPVNSAFALVKNCAEIIDSGSSVELSGFLKGYIWLDINIDVHVAVRRTSSQYHLTFSYIPDGWYGGGTIKEDAIADFGSSNYADYLTHNSVFALCSIIQRDKSVIPACVPLTSRVRFHAAEHVEHSITEFTTRFAFQPPFEMSRVFGNGKVEMLRRGSQAFGDPSGAASLVQGVPTMLDRLSDKSSGVSGQSFVEDELKGFVSSLRVGIGLLGCTSISKVDSDLYELVDISLSPRKLLHRTLEV